MKPRGGEGQNGRLKCPMGFLVVNAFGWRCFKRCVTNLVPRSGQVRKFDFFDWLFQNMAVTALKFERALRGFSGPLGNSMFVFMQIRHCARNHNICILRTFRCLQSASKVKKISSQFFIAL